MASPVPGWHHALAMVAILLVNGLVYARTLNLGFFTLDDPDYVLSNPRLTPLDARNLWAMLSQPWFDNYAPLHLLSYALDILLAGGKHAWALHLSNVLWHAWAAGMVYFLAWTVRPARWLPLVAGLLFVAHPAHVEVVAWISSRKDLLAGGFGALAMAAYLHARRGGAWGRAWYATSVMAFALGTAAKQSLVLLPAVMWIWDLAVERRRGWGLWLDKLPFGLIAVLFALRTLGVQPETHRPFDLYVAAMVQLTDLWLLSGFGDYVLYRPAPDPAAAGWGAKLVVGLAAAACWVWPLAAWRRLPGLVIALYAWVLVQLLPPILMRFTTPVTDRYLFLPSVGLCVGLALLIDMLARRVAGRRPQGLVAVVLGGLVACLWAWRTCVYVAEWQDPRSVWYPASQRSEAFQVAHYLGRSYHEAGDRVDEFVGKGVALDVERELRMAEAVLADAPRVAALRAEWRGDVTARTASRDYRDRLWALAWEQYERAAARRGQLNSPSLFLRRGKLLVSQGRFADAVRELRAGLELTRVATSARIRFEEGTHLARAVGIAHWRLRAWDEARGAYDEALRLQRESGRVWIAGLEAERAALEREAGRAAPPVSSPPATTP